MKGAVLLDTNLLVLLVVGSACKTDIRRHGRLQDYSVEHYELLTELILDFDDFVLLPHIVAEASNLCRQIRAPARTRIMNQFRRLVLTTVEIPIRSAEGVGRAEFNQMGVTDAAILHFCSVEVDGIGSTLITADCPLANIAQSLGYNAINFRADFSVCPERRCGESEARVRAARRWSVSTGAERPNGP